MFKKGDRVKFTNMGSWYDDFNGAVGTVIDDTDQNSIFVNFDTSAVTNDFIKDNGLDITEEDKDFCNLWVCSFELELIEEGSDNESNNN